MPTEFAAEHRDKDEAEGKFRNLNFSPSTKRQLSILLKFFFPLKDIRCFFSSIKLQNSRTIVLLNELKLLKRRRWSCDFPPRKTLVAQRHCAFPAKKRGHSPPRVGLPWDSPLPPPESVTGVRTYADVNTKISRIDRLPNFLTHGAPLCGLRSSAENDNE